MRLLLLAVVAVAAEEYMNEYIPMATESAVFSPLPHTYLDAAALPDNWNWGNVNGTTFLTKNLNQHIPQYCGSCWAHGALSALGDRIKIARKGKGIDINLAVQHVLNCGNAGSCHGGSHSATYAWIQKNGHVVYDTCNPYLACSRDSVEGACKGQDWSCSAMNTCRTCTGFTASGGKCVGIDVYPNATVGEHGTVAGEEKMMAEIYARGPIACGIDASPLHKYTGGVFDGSTSRSINHIISIVGWGTEGSTKFWIARNSWGEYWGEMGYFRIARGKNMLAIEQECAWATPHSWTEHNVGCYVDGSNCVKRVFYKDPSASLNEEGELPSFANLGMLP